MDSSGTNDNDARPDLSIQALDQGCLEELFSRCSTTDLPVLAQTCKGFKDLLAQSELVWAERLRADFGMNLDLHSSSQPGSLFPLAKQIYTAPSNDEAIRFQGTLVNGAVDDMNMWYWVDNLFKKDRSYFCSDASNNVDCLGLLLDNRVERDEQYIRYNLYMRRRCRYAAALFEHIHHPELVNADDILMNMIEEWSDQQLENFFLSLAENLENDANNPVGRLMFYDVPDEQIVDEEQRIRSAVAYLRTRRRDLKKDLIILPKCSTGAGCSSNASGEKSRSETLFDPTVLPKLQPEYPHRVSSIIYELHLSRAGSLTCPVKAGVIFVGVLDRSQLKGLDEKTVAERLQGATQDPICSKFNGVDSMEEVHAGIEEGRLPNIACGRFDLKAGFTYEFMDETAAEKGKTSSASTAGGKVPLISWRPLVWFSFKYSDELERLLRERTEDGGSSTEEEEEEENGEEESPPSSSSVDVSMHGAHSGALDQQQEPWNDADLEDMSQGQPLVYPAPAQGEAVAVGAAAPVAVVGHPVVPPAEQQQQPDEEEEEEEELPPFFPAAPDRTIGRNHLVVPLLKPVTANVIMVKLINQENLMDEMMDGHAYPNIDMTYVHIIGKKITMPEGIDLRAK